MKIVVLMGSPRKKDTYRICNQIQESLEMNKCTFEYINLSDYNLSTCKGCNQCFNKSELICPCNDQLGQIEETISSADGLIIASPVYVYQVPGQFKVLIDRLAYYFHRQKLIALPCMNIISSDGGGNKAVVNYLRMLSVGWGMHYVGSISIISPKYFREQSNGVFDFDPKYRQKMERHINKLTDDFLKAIVKPKSKQTSFYDLMLFNGLRSKIYTSQSDYNYWKEQNWIDADYFYKGNIGWIKSAFSKVMKFLIKCLVSNQKKKRKAGEKI